MTMARVWMAVVAVVVGSACGGTNFAGGVDPDGGAGTGGGTGTGGGGTSAYTGLPCDVAQLLAAKCGSCHGPSGTTAPKLVTFADLTTGTVADRVLARMQDAASPMPPASAGGPATAADIAVIQAWVNAGKPQGTCSSGVDAGTAGPQPTTCASGSTWTAGLYTESNDMNPGMACRQCHATHAPGKLYAYMGTVFPGLHEQDSCNASPPPSVVVEILNTSGQVVATAVPMAASGNFFAKRGQTAVPYTARVMVNGVMKSEMKGVQTNGDCNVCHTEQGTQGAPGRIVY